MFPVKELARNLRDKQVFTVESMGDEYHAVFPQAMAEYSALFFTEQDAWEYIAETILMGEIK